MFSNVCLASHDVYGRICRRTRVDRNVVYYMESKAKKKQKKNRKRICLGIMGIRENIIQIANKHHSGTQHQLHNGYLVSHVTLTLHSSWHSFPAIYIYFYAAVVVVVVLVPLYRFINKNYDINSKVNIHQTYTQHTYHRMYNLWTLGRIKIYIKVEFRWKGKNIIFSSHKYP